MSKKNIYFVQVGFAFDQSVYLPYAVGAIAAYAWQDETVKSEYALKELFFMRENLDSVISRLEKPYLVAFSNCVWNFEYNKAFVKKLKSAFPTCFVVFGGHNVPDSISILEEESAVDFLIHGEGEEPFRDLLKALPSSSFADIPNISFRAENGSLVKTPRKFYQSIEDYPSPYLTGLFDNLIDNHPGVDFLAVLETNRGCPYSCSYCDWCAGKQVRFFSMEKIKAEITWLSEHKIEYCFCADSNFGMFPRDLETVDFLVEKKIATGYPKVFRPCYAKDSDENVFQICRKLNTCGMDKGATLAYQTLSGDALANINRKNLTKDRFSNLLTKYNEAGIPSYSELILGLPGETYESFCRGLCELLEAGQHNSVSVYYCELLVNSEMAQKDYIEKYGIQIEKVAFNHIHSAETQGCTTVQEFSNLVVATKTMSRDMWVKSNIFSICVQCFHNLGLLRCFAIYMRYEQNLKYLDFYNKLIGFILNSEGTYIHSLFREIETKLSSTEAGNWNYKNEKFGDAAYFFEEGAFLETVTNYDRFWIEILPFIESFDINIDIRVDLVKYQKAIIKLPGYAAFEEELSYDFYGYFNEIYNGNYQKLKIKKNILHILSGKKESGLKEYAKETVWFGRRRGATLHTNNKGEATAEYLQE